MRALPAGVQLLSRLLISGKLYALPEPPAGQRRGRRPKKGPLRGAPKALARKRPGWQLQPLQAGAAVQAWVGGWYPVLPARPVRVVVVRRPAARRGQRRGQRKPPPPVAAFFTTDLTLSVDEILHQYRTRWAVESAIRAAYALWGLGHDQCRKLPRIVGANTFCLLRAAGRTRWLLEHSWHATTLDLQRGRPWYRPKEAPSHFDVRWACREVLHAAGISPTLRFVPELTKNHESTETTLPLAA